MSDEISNVSVSAASVVPGNKSTITKTPQKRKYTIKSAANHDEVAIMESLWIQIKRKVNLISLHKKVDVFAILFGAAIPYAIDIIGCFADGERPKYFPFFFCVFLMLLYKALLKYIPFLKDDPTTENIVHLNDLKNLIEQADTASKDSNPQS